MDIVESLLVHSDCGGGGKEKTWWAAEMGEDMMTSREVQTYPCHWSHSTAWESECPVTRKLLAVLPDRLLLLECTILNDQIRLSPTQDHQQLMRRNDLTSSIRSGRNGYCETLPPFRAEPLGNRHF